MRDRHPAPCAATRAADRGGNDRAGNSGDGVARGRAAMAPAPRPGRYRRSRRVCLRQQHRAQQAERAQCGRRHGPALPRHRHRDSAGRAGGHAGHRLAAGVAVPGSARRRPRLPGIPLDPPVAVRHHGPHPGWSCAPAAWAGAPAGERDDRFVRRLLLGGPGVHRYWYVPARDVWPGTLGRAGLAGRRPGGTAKLCAVGQDRRPPRHGADASRRVRAAGSRDRPARAGLLANRGPAVGRPVRRHVRGHCRDGVRLGRHAAGRAVSAHCRNTGLLLRRRPAAGTAAGRQRRSYRASAGRHRGRQRHRAPAVPGPTNYAQERGTPAQPAAPPSRVSWKG
jgi:hypothetical protein